jgi:hypothetical protein
MKHLQAAPQRHPRGRPPVRLAITLLFATVAAATAPAVEVSELNFHLGQALIGNGYTKDAEGNSVQGSDVSPLNFAAGFGVQLDVAPFVRFAPTMSLYWQEYLETPDGKVVPTQIETGKQAGELAGTIGVLLSLPYVYELRFSEHLALFAGLSPSLVLRFPVQPIEGSKLDGLYGYFYSEGRFLLPEASVALLYRLNERLRFGLNVRVFFPMHNLWTKYEVKYFDEGIVMPTLELRLTPQGGDR